MLSIDQYLRATSLEEAYEALQRKNSAVLGGMLWLRLGNRRITTAIDLSALGLDRIEETEDYIRIGAYEHRRRAVPQPGYDWRQYLWPLWRFRPGDNVPGVGCRGRAVSWRCHVSCRVLQDGEGA